MKLQIIRKHGNLNYIIGSLFVFIGFWCFWQLIAREITLFFGMIGIFFFIISGTILLSLPGKEYKEYITCDKIKIIKK